MNTKASKIESEKYLSPTGKESVHSSVLDSPSLPPEEKSLLRLEQEGALLVLAGTESPAKALTVIFYHILAKPFVLSNLQKDLKAVKGAMTWTKLDQLPYLSAVLEEAIVSLSASPPERQELLTKNLPTPLPPTFRLL